MRLVPLAPSERIAHLQSAVIAKVAFDAIPTLVADSHEITRPRSAAFLIGPL